jgi:hypothetical protein
MNPDTWETITRQRNRRFYAWWCAGIIAATVIWLVIQSGGLNENGWRTAFAIATILAAAAFFAYRGSREAPGPGKFRVVGVSKTTREDVFLDVDAASQANAKAKAEIEGIVVTKVYRVPER